MDIYNELVLNKLKKIIKEQFKTQKIFANHFNITETTISNWMSGKTSPSLDLLIQIAHYCNIHISYFFTDDSNNNAINEFISEEVFDSVFELAYDFAVKQNLEVTGSFFLGCYSLVKPLLNNNSKLTVEEAFNNIKPTILQLLKKRK